MEAQFFIAIRCVRRTTSKHGIMYRGSPRQVWMASIISQRRVQLRTIAAILTGLLKEASQVTDADTQGVDAGYLGVGCNEDGGFGDSFNELSFAGLLIVVHPEKTLRPTPMGVILLHLHTLQSSKFSTIPSSVVSHTCLCHISLFFSFITSHGPSICTSMRPFFFILPYSLFPHIPYI